MTLQFEDEQKQMLPFDGRQVAMLVINQVLDMESCPYEAELSLTLTDNQEIHRLNQQFRQIDRPTDVLSFPMVDFPSPAEYQILNADGWMDCFHPETGELMLGDIVISIECAERQALEYGHSLKREYAFLIAHSMLHLLGYDHMTPEEAKIMEEKQEAALQALNITREGE